MLLTREYPSGLPPELRDIGLVHYHGSGSNENDLKAVHAGDARHILILALDETDASSDSFTFDIAHRLSELSLAGKATAECVRGRGPGAAPGAVERGECEGTVVFSSEE